MAGKGEAVVLVVSVRHQGDQGGDDHRFAVEGSISWGGGESLDELNQPPMYTAVHRRPSRPVL